MGMPTMGMLVREIVPVVIVGTRDRPGRAQRQNMPVTTRRRMAVRLRSVAMRRAVHRGIANARS